MGMRRIGSSQRRRHRTKAHSRNARRKTRERASRDRNMVVVIKAGNYSELPWVMSWLSAKLDKAPREITPADVDQVLASVA
jgi:hypothetical protein